MQKYFLYASLILNLMGVTSCETEEQLISSSIDDIVLEKNNTLRFSNEKDLENFLKNSTDSEFETIIKKFQKSNFTPLLPILDEGDTKSLKKFIYRKINRLNADYKFSGVDNQIKSADNEYIDIDDELIKDDRFASVLNEDRSIYVGDYLYIYTTEGVFKTKIQYENEVKDLIRKYQENGVVRRGGKNPNNLPEIGDHHICRSNTGNQSFDLFSQQKLVTTQLTENIELIQVDPCGNPGGGSTGGGSGGSGGGGSGTSNTKKYPLDKKYELGTCVVKDESIWQQIFGAAETCNDYFSNNRRVKTKFWNQNYLIYSSIGVKVKHQKKNWGIWDASSATDFVELGINYASWTYKYESTELDRIYNSFAKNTLIKYKGKTYSTNGTVLSDYPVSVPNWPFNGDDPLIYGLEIYVFGNNILGSVNQGKTANKLLRDAAKDFIKKFGNILEGEADKDNIEVSGAVIDPFNRKLTFSVIGRIERDNNDCCATYYLDQNFLVGAKFNISHTDPSCAGGGCSSGGYNINGVKTDFFNAKSYENLTIDFYGLARRDGSNYKGKRVITNNIEID